MNTINNTSLKEYYTRLEYLYQKVVDMFTAINQSLTTTASEITVNIADTDDAETTLRIPSFLYMENKIEQLSNNFDTLFKLPESGEAWFQKSSNMYKLEMVKSNTAPVSPKFYSSAITSVTENNFLKDLVSPKTFLRMRMSELPDNIEKMFVKKFVIYSPEIFTSISNSGYDSFTYANFSAALYGLTKGVEYDEYDMTLDMPLRRDRYNSEFFILALDKTENDDNKDVIEEWSEVGENNVTHRHYKLHLGLRGFIKINNKGIFTTSSTKYTNLTYTDTEDASIEYQLKIGDKLCLSTANVIYQIKDINYTKDEIIIEELVGHVALQTYDDNSSMVLSLWNEDYSDYHYIDIPLEENQYIVLFFGSIYNNTRSVLTNAFVYDLSNIGMVDKNGNPITDETGAKLTYLDYYKKYCTNIGDLFSGLVIVSYPQITNYTTETINSLTSELNNEALSNSVTNTFSSLAKVIQINKHLSDTTVNDTLVMLHEQKNELNGQIENITSKVKSLTDKLMTTDFSKEIIINQATIKEELDTLYAERESMQQQMITIVNNISSEGSGLTTVDFDPKFRIRAITDVNGLIADIQDLSDEKVNIIQLEVDYKYVNTNKDITSVDELDGQLFTNWNRYNGIERPRQLKFNNHASGFIVEFDQIDVNDNSIKWNQIDIPIQHGEDVILRARYKYNISQPYIDLYTPWSSEVRISFPAEYNDQTDVSDIMEQNNSDKTRTSVIKELMDNGVTTHVNDKIIDGSQLFLHNADSIYSGFNTSENKYISLKDKLNEITNELEKYKSIVENEANQSYEVYLEYDGNTVQLSASSVNRINMYMNETNDTKFIKKKMNIVIKNTGSSPIKFYSIFPGHVDTPLLMTDMEFYNKYIVNYERVPVLVDEKVTPQTLGQWIYFRQNNALSGFDVGFNSNIQNNSDVTNFKSNKPVIYHLSRSHAQDYKSVLYSFRQRNESSIYEFNDQYWVGLTYNKKSKSFTIKQDDDYLFNVYNNDIISLNEKYQSVKDFSQYEYVNWEDELSYMKNEWIMRFENIYGKLKNTTSNNGNKQKRYLDEDISITDFLTLYSVQNYNNQESDFNGAFLYPAFENINDLKTDGGEDSYKRLPIGKTIIIPVEFEYFIDNTSDLQSITKALYFDLRDKISTISDVDHYMIEITANVDSKASTIMQNLDLYDEVTVENN